jgi:hypothetical protein
MVSRHQIRDPHYASHAKVNERGVENFPWLYLPRFAACGLALGGALLPF